MSPRTTRKPPSAQEATPVDVGAQLREQLARLEARLLRIEAHRHNTNRELSHDWDERAIEVQNDEVVEALLPHTKREIAAIKTAIHRLEAGDELMCESCGDPIHPKRLAIVPDTRYCTACAT